MSSADLDQTLAAIDRATGCQHCSGPLGGSVSDDFCGPECQQAWHAARSQRLTGYVEPYYTWAAGQAHELESGEARWRPEQEQVRPEPRWTFVDETHVWTRSEEELRRAAVLFRQNIEEHVCASGGRPFELTDFQRRYLEATYIGPRSLVHPRRRVDGAVASALAFDELADPVGVDPSGEVVHRVPGVGCYPGGSVVVGVDGSSTEGQVVVGTVGPDGRLHIEIAPDMEQFRLAMVRAGEGMRQLGVSFARMTAAMVEATRPLVEVLRASGQFPPELPTDPRERALALRRNRNTGPQQQRRAPRQINARGAR